MDNLVIFSSPWIMVLMLSTIALFTLCAVLRRFMGDTKKTEKLTEILSYIAIGLSTAIFVAFIMLRIFSKDKNSVSPEEMFFVFTVISTVALTASNAGRKEG